MELGASPKKLTVLRQLENELRRIQRQINTEKNPDSEANMLSAYGRISRALIGREM
jgi:hypothetical protein